MSLLPVPSAEQPTFRFGHERVCGRLVPSFLAPKIECAHEGMRGIISGLPSQPRWFWQPVSSDVQPDESGNSGVWTCCFAGKVARGFRADDGTAHLTEYVEAWTPFYRAVLPLDPIFRMTHFDELAYWMPIVLPVFQSSDDPRERERIADSRMRRACALVNVALHREILDEQKRRLRDIGLQEAVTSIVRRCDPVARRELSRRVIELSNSQEISVGRSIDPTYG